MLLKELFTLGGWAMWPLLIFSIVTIFLILERILYLVIHNLKTEDIKEKLLDSIDDGKVDEAIVYCQSFTKRRLASHIFLSGLKVHFLGEHRMEKSMETEAVEQINKLEAGFDLLVAIGSIAPITGFLGTVSGMIGAFQSIAVASEVNAQLVAGGIFEALITTAFGLSIAIISITVYNIFAHIVDKFSARIEEAGNELITRILIHNARNGM